MTAIGADPNGFIFSVIVHDVLEKHNLITFLAIHKITASPVFRITEQERGSREALRVRSCKRGSGEEVPHVIRRSIGL